MKSVFDRSFHYTPAVQTDIRKLFKRERQRLAEEKRAREANEAEATRKVSPMPAKKKAA